MFRKNYFTSFLTIALFFIGGITVFAQTAPVSGRIGLKGEGDKLTPVEGVLVEVYRTDIKAKPITDTTDKKGAFRFAGLPMGAAYAISVSGPGIAPDIIPNIKPGMDNLTINVLAGDGKRWTEDEVRQALANAANQSQTSQPTAEQKKAEEERLKQIAEISAKNEKVKKTNEIVNASLQEGSKAFDAKNYDLAIAKFEEGYTADPEYVGSAPVLLNNKALALYTRGTDSYNKSVTADAASKGALQEAAKKDFAEAVIASDKALAVLNTGTATDPNIQKNKMFALTNRKNAYRVMAQTGVEISKGKEALTAFQEYLAVETDPAKKAKAQLDLALTLQDSAEFDLAVAEFEKILAADPNNIDALAGIGLSLVAVGYNNMQSNQEAKGKEQLQQAANYLQKFVDAAPDTHKYKSGARDTIAELKTVQQVTPQKGKTTTTTKKKN
jgi:tetratricopeptide (TPR) repeat protein